MAKVADGFASLKQTDRCPSVWLVVCPLCGRTVLVTRAGTLNALSCFERHGVLERLRSKWDGAQEAVWAAARQMRV